MKTNKFPEQEKTKCKQGSFHVLLKKLSLHPLKAITKKYNIL